VPNDEVLLAETSRGGRPFLQQLRQVQEVVSAMAIFAAAASMCTAAVKCDASSNMEIFVWHQLWAAQNWTMRGVLSKGGTLAETTQSLNYPL
jgi:hypothetical protein